MTHYNTPIDIFISYSRADNTDGWVDALKKYVEDENERLHPSDRVNVFMDTTHLNPMDHWPYQLRKSLHQARFFLACVSPNYLQSVYCREEWDYFHSVHNFHSGFDDTAVVYFVQLPDSLDNNSIADWLKRIQEVQNIDITEWFSKGQEALAHSDWKVHVSGMYNTMQQKIETSRQRDKVPGNLRSYNTFFVGRQDALKTLRDYLTAGGVDSLTVVNAFGGTGKTQLLQEYANRAKADYPGGIWVLNAAGKTNFQEAFALLLSDYSFLHAFGISQEIAEEKLATPELAGSFVLEKIKERVVLDEKPMLLLFENIEEEDQTFFAENSVQFVPPLLGLHIAVTTRLNMNFRSFSRRWLNLRLDNLSVADGVQLLLEHQTESGLDFFSEPEKEAAKEIVGPSMLDGYALAIEQVAVALSSQNAFSEGPQSFREMLALLKNMGVVGFEQETGQDRSVLSKLQHQEKLLGRILDEFVMKEVKANEAFKKTLSYALAMPLDYIHLPYLREFVKAALPELTTRQKKEALNFLHNKQLVKLTQIEEVVGSINNTPSRKQQTEIGTMHRLIHAHLRVQLQDEWKAALAHIMGYWDQRLKEVRKNRTNRTKPSHFQKPNAIVLNVCTTKEKTNGV